MSTVRKGNFTRSHPEPDPKSDQTTTHHQQHHQTQPILTWRSIDHRTSAPTSFFSSSSSAGSGNNGGANSSSATGYRPKYDQAYSAFNSAPFGSQVNFIPASGQDGSRAPVARDDRKDYQSAFSRAPGSGGVSARGVGSGVFSAPPPPSSAQPIVKKPPGEAAADNRGPSFGINSNYSQFAADCNLNTDKSVRSAFNSGERCKWMPPSIVTSKNVQRASDDERNQAIFRKVRGILNKITPEKFDKLSESLIGLGLNTPALLKGVILLIFEKALEEPKYSSMYAQLCSKLSQRLPNFELPNSSTSPSLSPSNLSSNVSGTDVAANTFCRLLLIKCSNEFENRRKATEAYGDGLLSEEDEEARSLAKGKMLGNIKFICELGRQLLVHESILHTCIKELCSKKRNEKIQNKAEDLECLCQIMKTVGRLLDKDKAKPLMNQYFERIDHYSTRRELPSRIQFMLKDVLELRRNKWIPRRVQRENGPQTIGQIREEAARDLGMTIPSNPIGSGGYGDFTSQYANFSANANQFSNLKSPLYGHPGMPLQVGRPGQRALDDMGYYANLNMSRGRDGPGVIREDNFVGLGNKHAERHPSPSPSPPQVHVQGHMPYRGSNSQGTRRSGDRDNLQKQALNNNRLPRGPDGQDVAPRFRKGIQPQIGQLSRPMVQNLKPLMPGMTKSLGEISLRPAQNSMVVAPPTAVVAKQQVPQEVASGRSSPLLIKGPSSTRSSPTSSIDTSANNAKNVASGPTSKETLLKMAEEAITELAEDNINEIFAKIKGSKIPKNFQLDVVLTLAKSSINKSDLVSKLMTKLKNENVFGAHMFVSAYKKLVIQLSDSEPTGLQLKPHVVKLISQAVADDVLDLSETKDLVGDNKMLFLDILKVTASIQGETYVVEQLNENRIKLMDLLPEADRNKASLAKALATHEVSFIHPMLQVELDLLEQFESSDLSANSVYRWIKDNVDIKFQLSHHFVCVLFKAISLHVVKSSNRGSDESTDNGYPGNLAEVEKENFSKFTNVLNAFLNDQPELQLTALYSLQSVCHELGFPKGMMLRWFIMLYDLEVIEEEAFLKWKEDINDEYQGKGQALFQVNSWLTWLAETEETDSDEEEEAEVEQP
ncbi:Eukaryotic translation initiation factor 4 gamma 2 [Halotydeus destructor]|nr:Eukaryotic translation initiation factor 4 gamma 2 [Halotydeus destructor]